MLSDSNGQGLFPFGNIGGGRLGQRRRPIHRIFDPFNIHGQYSSYEQSGGRRSYLKGLSNSKQMAGRSSFNKLTQQTTIKPRKKYCNIHLNFYCFINYISNYAKQLHKLHTARSSNIRRAFCRKYAMSNITMNRKPSNFQGQSQESQINRQSNEQDSGSSEGMDSGQRGQGVLGQILDPLNIQGQAQRGGQGSGVLGGQILNPLNINPGKIGLSLLSALPPNPFSGFLQKHSDSLYNLSIGGFDLGTKAIWDTYKVGRKLDKISNHILNHVLIVVLLSK